MKRGRPKDDGTFWYVDAVEEALCFGWIDCTAKKISDCCIAQRFSPRQKRSNWSELNKERCRRMERLGRMTDAGRAVLPDMTETGFIIDPEILEALRSDPVVWSNFQNFPPLYQRVRIDTIQVNRRMYAYYMKTESTYTITMKAFKVVSKVLPNDLLIQFIK